MFREGEVGGRVAANCCEARREVVVAAGGLGEAGTELRSGAIVSACEDCRGEGVCCCDPRDCQKVFLLRPFKGGQSSCSSMHLIVIKMRPRCGW